MSRVASIVLAATIALIGCAGDGLVTGDRRNVGTVTVVFSARPARAQVRQPVRLTLTLVNNAGRRHDVVFPRKQFYDFWVRRGTEEVWRWSQGQVFERSQVTLGLESQNREVFSETWTPEAAGTYEVFGTVRAEDYDRPLAGRVIIE